jgi:hypothetical protein
MLRSTRVATWIAVVVLGLTARFRPRVARALVAVAIGTLGIAHGATDDATLERVGFRPRGGRATISLVYGSLAIVTFLAARRAPKLAARALSLLSWFHFGRGDANFARACGSDVDARFEAMVRGAIPLFITGDDVRSRAIASATVACAARHALAGRYADAADLALPTGLLLAIAPRLGFGIYFGAWHSVRHTVLLLERDSRGGSASVRWQRFAWESLPNVAIALGVGALAYAIARASDKPSFGMTNDDESEAIAGALILAITVPHEIAVGIIERRARLA